MVKLWATDNSSANFQRMTTKPAEDKLLETVLVLALATDFCIALIRIS
jgi:hypothetical protein